LAWQKHLDRREAFNHYRTGMKLKRLARPFAIILALGVGFSTVSANAQATDAHKADPHTVEDSIRAQAFDLYKNGRCLDAMPLFEQLSVDNPHDVALKESLAWCVMQYAGTLTDAAARKHARIRARKLAMQAKEMGDNSQILQVMLQLPEDGSDPVYSQSREVDDAMKTAEASFSRGDFDQAIAGYLQVIKLDPNNYDAPLFLGDVYFKQNSFDKAGEWFAKAIQIDPNRETAYRYWGDALAHDGKDDQARPKFIEAIVADPYNQTAWIGLTNWLHRNNLVLNIVRLNDGSNVTAKDDNHINITIASSQKANDPNTVAWMTYGIGRASWRGDRFKKEFPNEPQYRHTLKEESSSLELMITMLKQQKHYAKDFKKLDPSLQALIKIQEEGFLDPFVLLNRADAGIAKDYEHYRSIHREEIYNYLSDFVVPKTPAGSGGK
jgi:tetratricopeptide (TPR) repeat protein